MNAPVVHGKRLAWVRDVVPEGDWPEHMRAGRLLGAGPVALAANEDLVASVLNQKAMGSCVAHGTVQAARGEMIRAGNLAAKLGSRLWIYFLARAYDHDTANDDGTQIHQAFAAIAKYGLPDEEVWPYDDNTSPGAPFSRMPPPEAFWAALDAKFSFTQHRITSTGYDRVDDVKRALAQRRLVVFGTDVSEDFCAGNFDATVPLDPPVGQTLAGGHCRAYVTSLAGGVRVVNSWDTDWGDGGYSVDSYDYVAWDQTNDLWVFDSAPKALVGGAS